jgi:hypothetical protein
LPPGGEDGDERHGGRWEEVLPEARGLVRGVVRGLVRGLVRGQRFRERMATRGMEGDGKRCCLRPEV